MLRTGTGTTTARIYKGQRIYECERAPGEHRGRWIVLTYHSTGTPNADELCPHYRTLALARESIRERQEREAARDEGMRLRA